jgi:YtxH-like protein
MEMNLQDISNNLSLQDLAKLFRSEPDHWHTESLFGSLALLGAGALIGATVALFFAPKSGAELRRDVGDQLRTAGDKVSASVDETSSRPA